MSVRLRISLILMGSLVAPAGASADDLAIPGLGAALPYPRPSYNEAYFPPPQHDALGQPVPPPAIDARPTYRETYNDFPTGRYGGGFIEYVLTGGHASPVDVPAAPVYAAPLPGSAPVAYGAPASARGGLPASGLPDYAPQPPAYYGSAPTYSASVGPTAPTPTYGGPASYDPVAADPGLVTRPMNPVYYRQMVSYAGHERPGTIVIDTPNKFLYLVESGGRAIRYGIGVGRPGFAWSGIKRISRKAEWPDWTPPSEMLARRPDLPRHMEGGEANPLGARALYLGSSLYRIHGTNEPYTIGTNVSSGCIRMMNQDVIDLYNRVGIGTRVIVL
jgi:lipoprotein-anchoring transpeptidase ErfK/SrfK